VNENAGFEWLAAGISDKNNSYKEDLK